MQLCSQSVSTIRIVIADDHPIFRDALCRILSFEPDLRVVAQVDDVQEVLEAIHRYRPDILLLDLNIRIGRFGYSAEAKGRQYRNPSDPIDRFG
jgi:DNA-binding NarL/FixJ family response regulator